MKNTLVHPEKILGNRRFELEKWRAREAISPATVDVIYNAAQIEYEISMASRLPDHAQLDRAAYMLKAESCYESAMRAPNKHKESSEKFLEIFALIGKTMERAYNNLLGISGPTTRRVLI